MPRADSLHRGLLLFLVVGLLFSGYAAYESSVPSAQGTCYVNSYVQCKAVDESSYSHVGPVYDWEVGLGGFLAMLIVEVLLLRSYDIRYLRVLLGLSLTGLGVSVVLGTIEVAIIHAFCPVCLGAYISNLGVLGCTLGLVRARREVKEDVAREGANSGSEEASSEGNASPSSETPEGAPEASDD